MMRFLLALCAALILTCAGTANASAAGFVHRDGRDIVDGNGQRLWLNGVNIGGYLMWEGWIIGGGPTAETPMTDKLDELVGTGRAAQFRQDMRDTFITRADFESMKAMGINTVRVPFNHRLLEEDADGGFKTLDRLVADARSVGLYLVLDLHGAPGGQNPGFIADPDLNRNYLWLSETSKQATVELWRRVAARYANEPTIAGYDLLNEPSTARTSDLLDLYARIITAVRSVDTNHLLFIEGNAYAKDFGGFTRLDENLAFSFHQYPLDKGDPDNYVDLWVAQANAANVPLWNGEFGQSNYDAVDGQMRRVRNHPGVDGLTLWTWKLADRNLFFGTQSPSAAAPVKFIASDAWMDVVRYISTTGAPKPSPDRAEAGLQSFIAATSFARNAADSTLAALMRGATLASLRQPAGGGAAAGAPAAAAAAAAPAHGTVATPSAVTVRQATSTSAVKTTPAAKRRSARKKATRCRATTKRAKGRVAARRQAAKAKRGATACRSVKSKRRR